ncbi:MAG: HIT family protein [Cellulosilyticaceae bacterium]
MMNQECLFCKIIEGVIPSYTIYEDEDFKVILDRFPASKGHMLILPKMHMKDIFELDEQVGAKLYPLAKKMAQLLKNRLSVEGVNIVQNNGIAAGQTIDHFHLHLVPRYTQDGVVLNKTMNQETTLEELSEVAKLLLDK